MLRFENVTYTYPFAEKPAVRGIDFEVRPGEVVLVTGRSGCGKSTLMRLANGLCPGWFKGRLEGRVLVDGKSTLDLPLKDMSRLCGTLFQDPEQQFFALGVEDELAFVHEWRGLPAEETREKVRSFARSFGIGHILGQSIHELSEGQKQKVGLASIMSQEPKVLVLDEPTANLDPESTVELAHRLRMLKESGMAILVVDHRLYWLEGVADRVLVMKEGEVVAQGNFGLLKDDGLRASCGLRGWHVDDARPHLPESAAPAAESSQPERGFRMEGVTFAYKGQAPIFEHASAFLAPGVTALIGDNGAGKTTLARLMTGLNKAQSGRFFFNGAEIAASDLLRRVGIVLQNADHQLHMKTVAQELEVCLELAERLEKQAAKQKARERREDAAAQQCPAVRRPRAEQVRELLELFGLEGLAERHPQSLSGGEKQRLVIACAFAKRPRVLILDEPTSGLDGENMRRIANALRLLAEHGACVLVITHDLELMKLSCSRALLLPLTAGKNTGPAPHNADKE